MVKKTLIMLAFISLLWPSTKSFSQTDEEIRAIREALLENDRMAKDEWFRSDPESPLSNEQKESFPGLDYFEVKPGFKVFARLSRDEIQETVSLKMSNNSTQDFTLYGSVTFSLSGSVVTLSVFRDQNLPEMTDNPGSLFIPFSDKTTGNETNANGRYLILDKPADEQNYSLDFNHAINPFGAYNGRYSSVLPPEENIIPLPVNAGEKKFTK